uniref:T-complex protein 11-like protein 1 n=1 Tax=Ascaris suum TaxID=6253 RepID=F1L0Q4_ASCSU
MPLEDNDEKGCNSGKGNKETSRHTPEGLKGDENANEPPSSSSGQLKRKRVESERLPVEGTETSQFPSWVAGGSPTSFVERDRLMEMSAALGNMALVHEISLNADFEFSTVPSDPVEKAVKECMHRAFWDKLRDDINNHDPPDYSHAFGVLPDIKKMILDIIPADRIRLLSEVESQLDETLLKQQLERGCIDVARLSAYLVDLLSRLCAPCREEQLNKIRHAKDLVETLRSTCELLEVMKVDMANFYLKQNRPVIEAYSAEYELEQFMKVMDADPDLRIAITDWLMRHIDADEETASGSASPSAKKRFEDLSNSEVSAIISRAYLELLDWSVFHSYPTTLMIDRFRLEELGEKLLQLIICTSCVLITCNLAGREVSERNAFKTDLKNQLLIITNCIERSKLKEQLEGVFVQCEDAVEKCYEELRCGVWTDERKAALRAQVLAVADPNNQVRKLMRSRMNAFILSMISGDSSTKAQRLPAGISMVQQELTAVTAHFARIIEHNRATFGTLYGQLLKEAMSK